MTKKRVLVVDFANSFFTLHHFKIPDKTWTFINDIRRIVEQFKIDRIILAPEGGKSSYRIKIHPEYKQQRKEQVKQWTEAEQKRYTDFKYKEMPAALDTLKMFGMRVVQVKGVESDDVQSFIVRNIDLDRHNVFLLTTDQDMLQLLRPGVVIAGYNKKMTLPLKNGERLPAKLWLNSKTFIEQYSDPTIGPFTLEPWRYAHVKALSGDISDNYLSPKGLGETFALKLIQKYGDIYGVEDNLDNIKIPRLTQRVIDELKSNYSVIHHNLKLANLNHTPEVDLEIFGQDGIDYLYQELEAIDYTPEIDLKGIKEYCFEHGKVNVVDRLGMWLSPFSG